ncbi:glycoside hydrolase family 3 C-terminal domain-containing protein [Synechococcus sp. J7-Johnson]|uniref:beta-glucosidase family protein n=1 Tax=Synechococcus sp. J7-Johnson TaxID=2823737 RepID=UPI0020CB6D44|nr:glycoside hydrolase family 3 C-terminal domain-containing protein [Synechococcus sp. J7-Johnson]MCP9841101.1 glycoside hydrolase family 3 C-terminal domain-containing protein [Synechococcus sp. J7-Johnson]
MHERGSSSQEKSLELLAELTTAEKLELLDGDTPFWSGMADIALHQASHRHPWPAAQVPRLGLAGLQFVDGPRGVVLEGGATTFPVPMARGACWDPDLEQRIGEAIAREARSFGANWVAGVCINLLRHPGWGRAQETYGEDPVHVGALGAAMTRGLERHAVACVKHFALNSIDSSRFLVDVQVSERVLHELYLPHFRDCVEAGAGSMMSAYNQVNGHWCGQHPELLRRILKQRWGFRGFVVCDFIFGVRDGVAAVLAGQDLEMPFGMVFAGCLPEAVADGRVPMGCIDEAVLRLLQVQLRVPAGAYPASLRSCETHRALAREAATSSIVLLRNEGQVLPFKGLSSLAVIGRLASIPNLGDRGSSDTRPLPGTVVTPLDGLRAAAPDLRIEQASGSSPLAAAALAARCDAAVVVAGLDWRLEGEHIHPGDIAPILRLIPPPDWLLRLVGRRRLMPFWRPLAHLLAWITSYASARQGGDFAAGDRTDLNLPADQVALIRQVASANPRTVVVLMGGGGMLIEDWRQLVPGLLLLWYPGEQGGAALADVLLGRVSPSGRLPFSMPTQACHLPPFEPRARRVVYDFWHGYRRLQRDGNAAAFPFGFGLSYSQFTASELTAEFQRADGRIDHLQTSVTITNTGEMEAAEVVQIYLEPPARELERPARTLVAFQRLHLAAGEARRITLTVPLRALARFDPAQDGFVTEEGTHRLVVARHVEDVGLAVALEMEAARVSN